MNNDTKQATRHELAMGARQNYENNVEAAGVHGHWTSTIGHAIDAWEREPELLERLRNALPADYDSPDNKAWLRANHGQPPEPNDFWGEDGTQQERHEESYPARDAVTDAPLEASE